MESYSRLKRNEYNPNQSIIKFNAFITTLNLPTDLSSIFQPLHDEVLVLHRLYQPTNVANLSLKVLQQFNVQVTKPVVKVPSLNFMEDQFRKEYPLLYNMIESHLYNSYTLNKAAAVEYIQKWPLAK
jgi:hypothetical protein